MAQDIKIKRSSVPGKTPEVSALQLGELATNTHDGKLFLTKDVSGNKYIVSIGDLSNDSNPTLSANLNLNNHSISGTGGSIDVSGGSINLSGELDRANIQWNTIANTYNISMGNGVVQQVGEEIYYPLVKNNTEETILNGTPVWCVGGDGNYIFIGPHVADGSLNQLFYFCVATEDIASGSWGRITYLGDINDIDTSMYEVNDLLYVSEVTAGAFTTTRPKSPNQSIISAIVTHKDSTNGRIFVRYNIYPNSTDVLYDNTSSTLISSNIQAAISELDSKKANLNTIAANINLYSTIVSAGVDGYYKLVDNTEDSSYPVSAINVSTGPISATNQYIAGLSAPAGLFVGNPGIVNVSGLE